MRAVAPWDFSRGCRSPFFVSYRACSSAAPGSAPAAARPEFTNSLVCSFWTGAKVRRQTLSGVCCHVPIQREHWQTLSRRVEQSSPHLAQLPCYTAFV